MKTLSPKEKMALKEIKSFQERGRLDEQKQKLVSVNTVSPWQPRETPHRRETQEARLQPNRTDHRVLRDVSPKCKLVSHTQGTQTLLSSECLKTGKTLQSSARCHCFWKAGK